MMKDSRDEARRVLQRAVEFHGHLGPFLMIGLRMGFLAMSALGSSPDEMSVLVKVKSTPPESCAIDGLQVSTGCTLGRGTIRVSETLNHVGGEFRYRNRMCAITVRSDVVNDLLVKMVNAASGDIMKIADDTMERPDAELFDVAVSG
jgi:formylmethanofuran dehydrogenase subunit E